MNYDTLFSPMKIGAMEVSTRLVVPAMVTNYGTPDGMITDRYVSYMVAVSYTHLDVYKRQAQIRASKLKAAREAMTAVLPKLRAQAIANDGERNVAVIGGGPAGLALSLIHI